ncbi:MAG: hypothetical protein KAW67_07885, partial [Candidatus Eisenbacteria sp.]|nr:hypothetical protein [Candidatus Eisenbacteria bacterium]
ASATCVPPQEGESRGGLLSMFSQIGVDLGARGLLSSTPMTDFMIGVLKSNLLRDQVVDGFDLQRVYDAESRDHAAEDLSDHLIVTTTPEGFIEVRVEDRDRQRAANMANAFMEFLDDYSRRTSVEQAERTREFVESALEENGRRLLTASEALREFQEEHGAIDLTEQTRATVEAIATLETERTWLEVRRGVLEGFSHPDQIEMREIDAKLRGITKKLGRFTGRGDEVPPGSNEDGALLPLASIPKLVVRLADLTRDVVVQQRVREFLSSQLEEARIQETRDLEIIHVLDAAVPPLKKSRPRRSLIVILSVGLVFVGSVGVAFVADSFLHYARGSHPDSEFASSRESKVLLRFARGLRNWGGPRQDEGSS